MKTQSFCLKKAQVDLDFCHLSYGNKTEVLLCVYAGLFHYLMADISVPYLRDPQYAKPNLDSPLCCLLVIIRRHRGDNFGCCREPTRVDALDI